MPPVPEGLFEETSLAPDYADDVTVVVEVDIVRRRFRLAEIDTLGLENCLHLGDFDELRFVSGG